MVKKVVIFDFIHVIQLQKEKRKQYCFPQIPSSMEVFKSTYLPGAVETNCFLHLCWSLYFHTNLLLIRVQDQSEEFQPELSTVPGSQAN